MEVVPVTAVSGAKRILIISTYNIRCGMASHTEVLISHLGKRYSIDVFPLDQFVLRNRDKRASIAGDQAIRDLCPKLALYDVTIMQWEPGFWGLKHSQILKRVKLLTDHVQRLVLVKHTVMPEPAMISYKALKSVVNESGFSAALNYATEAAIGFHSRLYGYFKKIDRRGQLTVITHTRRDKRFLELVVGFSDVRDHPLCHIHDEWADSIEADGKAERRRLETLYGADSIFVSTFGFLAEHKSLDTALTSLRMLPENYKLLIYGGIHQYTIKEFEPINPYVKRLVSTATGDPARLLKFAGASRTSGKGADLTASSEAFDGLFEEVKPIKDRVIFMGAPDDYQFAVAIAASDISVLPYLEVGQSASGPASQIVELGSKFIATNAKPFAELVKYFPDRISMFDIGNYMQLATAIRTATFRPPHKPFSAPYNSGTQRDFYISAIEDTFAKASDQRKKAAA